MISMHFQPNYPLQLITEPDAWMHNSYSEILFELDKIHTSRDPATLFYYEIQGRYYLDWRQLTRYHFTLILNNFLEMSRIQIEEIAKMLGGIVESEVDWVTEGF